jgi:hypothetical protein
MVRAIVEITMGSTDTALVKRTAMTKAERQAALDRTTELARLTIEDERKRRREKQGNRFRLIFGLGNEALQVIVVEVGLFSSDLEAVLVLWVSDEVHGYVFDHGHVLRPEVVTQAGEVVVEDDVEHSYAALATPHSVPRPRYRVR